MLEVFPEVSNCLIVIIIFFCSISVIPTTVFQTADSLRYITYSADSLQCIISGVIFFSYIWSFIFSNSLLNFFSFFLSSLKTLIKL